MSEYDAADDCVKSYYAAIEAKRLRGDAESVDVLARQLFSQANLGIWAAADYGTQLWFRREAARKLQEAATRERV